MKGMDFMIFVNLNFVIKKFPYGGWFNFFFFFLTFATCKKS